MKTELQIKSDIQCGVFSVSVSTNPENPNNEYAFYLFKDGEKIDTKWYTFSSSADFPITSEGFYYATCFVRNDSGITTKHTELSRYPQPASPRSPFLGDITEHVFQIESSLKDRTLTCEVIIPQGRYEGLEFAYYLLCEGQKVDTKSYTPYHKAAFILDKAGIYSILCFIRHGGKIVARSSSLYGFGLPSPSRGPSGHCEPMEQAAFVPSDAPYSDFAFVAAKFPISEDAIARIREMSGLSGGEETCIGAFYCKTICEKDASGEDVILSGLVNEGDRLLYGQKDAYLLPGLKQQGIDLLQMTGKFTYMYKDGETITFSFDYFGSQYLYYYTGEETVIVSNRIHLVLMLMNALNIHAPVNHRYVAASVSYDDGLISSANFLNELALKGLYFLPLDKYLVFGSEGLAVRDRGIGFTKIPYDDKRYRELLAKAREDMIAKLENIHRSPDITQYRLDLSGGFDSRLVLAVLLNNPELIKSIKAYTKNVSTSNDLEISLWLTNHYKIPFYHFTDYGISFEDLRFPQVRDKYRSISIGMYHTLLQTPDIMYVTPRPNRIMRFVGAFGETMRSRYYMQSRELLKLDDSAINIVNKLVNKINYRISYSNEEDFITAYRQQIESLPGATDLEKYDNMYSFFHLRYHSGSTNDMFSIGDFISVFQSKYMYEASRMLTLKERSKNKIMMDMTYILWPELLSFPYSSYANKDEGATDYTNLIFDPSELPSVEFNGDRTAYDEAEHHRGDMLVKYRQENPFYNDNSDHKAIYSDVIRLYFLLRGQPDISRCFDDHMYWHIIKIKDNQGLLLRIYSKLMGIYDQLDLGGIPRHWSVPEQNHLPEMQDNYAGILLTQEENRLKCSVLLTTLNPDIEFAFYLFRDGERIETIWYTQKTVAEFALEKPGIYHVAAFLKQGDEIRVKNSDCVQYLPVTE